MKSSLLIMPRLIDATAVALEEERYMQRAAEVALLATCERSRCGSVIVKDGTIIGEGFNAPPRGLESQRRCQCKKASYHPKVTDKTCCVHAEQRAILEALKRHGDKIQGATLYFIRLDTAGKIRFSGQPYCTICSKLALDVGIAYFVLWHESGITQYATPEYHTLSYAYQSDEIDSLAKSG